MFHETTSAVKSLRGELFTRLRALRYPASELVRQVIEKVIVPRIHEPRIIYDRDGKTPYLSRYYITQRPRMADGSDPFEAGQLRKGVIWPDAPFGLFLHYFHRGDDDKSLHNHPWRWACSFILAGGYSEERRGQPMPNSKGRYYVENRVVPPLSFNFIKGTDFHRVDLIDEERGAWSLFLVGPKITTWGFWDRHTGEFVGWREFISRKRGDSWQKS